MINTFKILSLSLSQLFLKMVCNLLFKWFASVDVIYKHLRFNTLLSRTGISLFIFCWIFIDRYITSYLGPNS